MLGRNPYLDPYRVSDLHPGADIHAISDLHSISSLCDSVNADALDSGGYRNYYTNPVHDLYPNPDFNADRYQDSY